MKRRHLLAAAWPLSLATTTWALRGAQPRRIGFLIIGAPLAQRPRLVVDVLATLAQDGLAEGAALQVHVQYGQTPAELDAATQALLARRVELIVASLTPAAQAAQRATRELPIVMSGVGDPVANGLVRSLAAPGGNITGTSAQATELTGKNLELLRDWLPGLRQVAVLAHATDPWAAHFVGALEQAAGRLGFTLMTQRAVGEADYPGLFTRWSQQGAQALVIQPSLPFAAAAALALHHRWPSCSPAQSWPARGGLFAYSVDPQPLNRTTASYVQRILQGEHPSRLPVQQPTRFKTWLNLRTARELGLAVPAAIRLRADEVIE